MILGETSEEQLKILEIILETLREANLEIQADKSEWLKTEVELLGFIIAKDGLKSNPNEWEYKYYFSKFKRVMSILWIVRILQKMCKKYATIDKLLTGYPKGENGH